VNSELRIAAVDVGNTTVKVAVFSGSTLKVLSVDYGQAHWERTVVQFTETNLPNSPLFWRIASVNQSSARKLEGQIIKTKGDAIIDWITRESVPMPVSVDQPEKLGIDRLLGGFAASKRYATPLVVVSFGTAVTVDLIDRNGLFTGGLILPGLRLQSDSLSSRTEALPELQWDGSETASLPGKNTVSAVRSGIILGLASAIDGLIMKYADSIEQQHQALNVVITGGDATTITHHLQHDHHIVPNLVCHALMELPGTTGKPSIKSNDV
jgi:type III pantothenate kinase